MAKGRVYLVATGDARLSELAARAYGAIGKKKACVAISYAPVAGDAAGLKFMSERMPRLFPDATIEPIGRDPAVVERADLVFVSGGDPTLGAAVLDSSGAGEWIRAASARGVPTMGVSAGAIVLGAWWADWPEEDAPDDEARLIACAGVLGDVFDVHNEEDDWDELRLVARLCAGQKPLLRFIGIPNGGALVFEPDGRMEVVGTPPFQLAP